MTITKDGARERISTGTRIALKNILYLTDFSECSQAALPLAAAVAENYGARIHVLHVLTPAIPEGYRAAVEADEKLAADEMKKIEEQMQGLNHETTTIEGMELWPAVERAIKEQNIDMIVLGTHGRTRARKLLLGSVAEEIFRRADVPVLTIGPDVPRDFANKGPFRSILFATDFGKPCEAAAPFAISLAEETAARLALLYAVTGKEKSEPSEQAIADIVKRLRDIVPPEAGLWCRPSVVVRYGDPTDRILETAAERDSDLIVLGIRSAGVALGAATHLERAIAHRVVVHAKCPVLTVRG